YLRQQDPNWWYRRTYYRPRVYDWRQYYTGPRLPVSPEVAAYERRREDYRRDIHDDGARCKPMGTAVGHEAYCTPVAKEEGEQSWMEEVRSRFGSRYMDLRNSRRLTYECYRSSTGNRNSEKTADVAGKVLEQCRIEAVPCRSDKEYASDEDTPPSRNLKEDNERRGSRLFRRFQQWRQRHKFN